MKLPLLVKIIVVCPPSLEILQQECNWMIINKNVASLRRSVQNFE